MDKCNEALLSLNREFTKLELSREYNLGRRILKYVDMFRRLDLPNVYKRIREQILRYNASISQYFV